MRAARPSSGLSLALTFALSTAGTVLAAAPAGPKAAAAAPETQKTKPPRVFPGEAVEFKTVDGWTLSGSYLPAGEGKKTFLLLHEAGGSRHNWYWFARKLARKGWGMLALDLRGHGGSQAAPPGEPSYWRKFRMTKENNDWDNMREDISSAVAFLKEKGVDPGSVALGGAAVGGSVAIRYAALHPEVPLVFILSPGMSHQKVPTINALRAYHRRPVLLVVGEDDKRTSAEIPIIFQFAKLGAGPENAFLLRAPKGHGTRLLYYNKGLMDKILEWTDNPIQPPELEISLSTSAGAGAEDVVAPKPAPRSTDGLPTEDEMDQEYGSSNP